MLKTVKMFKAWKARESGAGARVCSARSGFSLLEILVVVLIITILATIVGVNVAKEPGKARMAAAKTQIGMFRTAIQLYRMDNGRVPTQEQGLQALVQKPDRAPVPAQYRPEGYLESRQLPRDPWGGEYVYLSPASDGSGFEIICYGADGQPGGDGEDADLSSLGM